MFVLLNTTDLLTTETGTIPVLMVWSGGSAFKSGKEALMMEAYVVLEQRRVEESSHFHPNPTLNQPYP